MLHRPLESCTTRESCHSWVFRLGVAGEARGEAGRGVPAQRTRLALCEAARRFRGFISCSFELSPLMRTMPLLLRLLSRETCSLPSRVRCVHSAPPYAREAHSLRVVELVGASHEGDTHSPVAASVLWAKRRHRRGLPHRVAASARLAACVQLLLARGFITPVHITVEAAGLCRLPQKTWRCDGVSLNCCCSAVLF